MAITNQYYWGVNSNNELHLSNSALSGSWVAQGQTDGVYSAITGVPWYNYRNTITKVVIDNAIAPQSVAYMFGRLATCEIFENLDLLDTSNVTSLSTMFYYCEKITSLDLSNFDTSLVTKTSYMFAQCVKLKTIYASEMFDMSKVKSSSSSYMFTNCTSLVGGNGTTYNASYVTKTYARIDKVGQLGYFTEKISRQIQAWIKINDVAKKITNMYVKVGNELKNVTKIIS